MMMHDEMEFDKLGGYKGVIAPKMVQKTVTVLDPKTNKKVVKGVTRPVTKKVVIEDKTASGRVINFIYSLHKRRFFKLFLKKPLRKHPATIIKEIPGEEPVMVVVRDKEGKVVMEQPTIKEKHAYFVIIPDTDPTYNFIVSIMYTQLFNTLVKKADTQFKGRLPVHVRFILDEFANIGTIPNFDKLIATIRSREISATIILQTKSQLKDIYKDAADTIIGNCDCEIFLGGKETGTLESISKMLGKETIDSFNTSKNGGNQSGSTSYQKMGRELMSIDEVAVMDNAKCILQIRGERPFFSAKYDTTKHKNWVLLSDFDESRHLDPLQFVADYRAKEDVATEIKHPVVKKETLTTKDFERAGFIPIDVTVKKNTA